MIQTVTTKRRTTNPHPATIAQRVAVTQCASPEVEAPPGSADVVTGPIAVPSHVIDGGEIILLAIKPSMWRPVFDALPCLLTCAALVAVVLWREFPLPGLSMTATIQMIFLIVGVRLGMAVVRWVPTWHMLTNRRVINIQGVRAPRVSSCPLKGVCGVSLTASPLEKITSLGTISFETTPDNGPLNQWESVASPNEVRDAIKRAVHDASLR